MGSVQWLVVWGLTLTAFGGIAVVGDIAILAGWVLLAASTQVLLATLPGIACFLLAPIPEERALSEKLGEAYEEYREDVPRFL